MERDRSQPESQEPTRSIEFTAFGYDKDDKLTIDLQKQLQKNGGQVVVRVATEIFGSHHAAYAAGVISEQELKFGGKDVDDAFRQGTFKPTDENIMRLLIAVDIAQHLKNAQYSTQEIRTELEKKRNGSVDGARGLSIQDELNAANPENLATLHSELREKTTTIIWTRASRNSPQRKSFYGSGLNLGQRKS
jgi:hypothetical protein